MSWLSGVRDVARGLAFLGQATKATGVSNESMIQAWWSGRNPDGQVGLSAPYAEHATTYRGVNIVARSMARIPLEVRPVGGRSAESIPDHWLLRLLRSPGQGRAGTQLIQATTISLKLRGEAFYWHKELGRGEDGRDGVQRPTALWMLNPVNMQPGTTIGDNGLPTAWHWSGLGGVRIPAEELTYIRYENPYDPIRGLGPVQTAMIEVDGDHLASSWSKSFYENQAIPPIVFIPRGGKVWQDRDREKFLASWNSKLQGVGNRGLAGAMPSDIDVKELKFTQREAQHLEERGYRSQRVLGVLGVQPFMAGDLEHASWANSFAQRKTFWMDNMSPDAMDLGACLTSELLARYESGLEVVFNIQKVLAEVLAEETKLKVESAEKLWAMGFSAAQVNERLQLGMEIDDSMEHLSRGFLPANVVLADDMLGGDDDEEPEEGPPPPPNGDDPDEDETDQERAARRRAQLADAMKDADRERLTLYTGLARAWGSRSRQFNRAYRSWLWKLRTETLTNLTKLARERNVKAEEPVDVDPLQVLFDQQKAQQSLRRFAIPLETAALIAGGQGELAAFDIEFDHLSPEVREVMLAKEVKLMESVPKIRETVRLAVIEGMEAGESVTNVAKRIRQRFDIQRSRSLTIARTEMAQAFSSGRFFGIKQNSKRGDRIEWVSSRDKRVRTTHADLDGKSVLVGERFANQCRFPSDPTGPADQVINCRCQPRRVRGRR